MHRPSWIPLVFRSLLLFALACALAPAPARAERAAGKPKAQVQEATPEDEGPEDEEADAEPAPAPAPNEKPGLWRRLWPAPEASSAVEAEPASLRPAADQGDRERREARLVAPTRHLGDVQKRLRASAVGADPAGARYLDLVDHQQASLADLNGFGIYLAERGLLDDALEYFRVALRADRNNPDLWNNVGTVHRQIGDTASAMTAFEKAVSLDPNHALAHYNLGAAHDAEGHYDQAIEEYRTALTLDPRLGNTKYNPQVVNNDRMLVVKLLLYQREAGALGLPLVRLPGDAPPPPAAIPVSSKGKSSPSTAPRQGRD